MTSQISWLYFGGVAGALLIAVIACATPSWANRGFDDFDSRVNGLDESHRLGFGLGRMGALEVRGYGRAVLAMSIIGILLLAFATTLEVVMLAVASVGYNSKMRITSLCSCGAADLCLFIALCVFGDRITCGGYSLWLMSAAFILSLEALVICLLDFFGVI